MNIQQNFNAMLALGAVAARTSDKYQENAQYRRLEKATQAQDLINEQLSAQLQESENPREQAAISEKQSEISKAKEQAATEQALLKKKPEDIAAAVQAKRFSDIDKETAEELKQDYQKDIAFKNQLQAEEKAKETALNELSYKYQDYIDMEAGLDERFEQLEKLENLERMGFEFPKGGKR